MTNLSQRLLAVFVATAATAAVGVGVAGSAGAATHHPLGTAGLSGHVSVSPGAHPDSVSTTPFGAGYFLYPGDGGIASVSATFKMPSITCLSSTNYEWLLPGIWVYDGGALVEQVDVNFNCNSGVQLLEGFVCLTDGCSTEIAVAPGDKIITSLAYTSLATTGTVRDVTAGTSSQFVGAANTTDDVVFVGDAGPIQFLGGEIKKVPQFSTVHFTSVQINGDHLVYGPAPTRYALESVTTLQIGTSPIESGGSSFTTTYKHT